MIECLSSEASLSEEAYLCGVRILKTAMTALMGQGDLTKARMFTMALSQVRERSASEWLNEQERKRWREDPPVPV